MRWLFLSALALLGSGACGGDAARSSGGSNVPGHVERTGEVWLTVNVKEITEDMVMATARLMPEDEIERLKRSGGWVHKVEQVGIGEVLYLGALEKGMHKEPEVEKAIAMSVRETLAQENFRRQVEARITDGTIKKYYEDRKVQYKRDQAHARHILVREEALAQKLIEQLKGGADFAALVKEHSLDNATKDKGGDLGWFNKDMLDPSIAKVTFEGPMNEAQGPIETRFGYHIFEVLERRDQIPLEEVRAEIVNKLRQQEAETVLADIKAQAKMVRMGEIKEIYDRTKDWGSPDNPMGDAPPPPRVGADKNLPGVRMEDEMPPVGGGGHSKGNGHGAPGPHGGGH